jgi:adenylate cyclase
VALGTSQSVAARESNEPQIRIREPSPPENLEGERKTVTALFADIKGSMEVMEDLDPEEAGTIVDPALRLMIDAADHYGGHVVQSTGDGIFALFGAPIAHEDHPQRALFSALRMQTDVKRYAEKLRAEKGVNLQVRVGVHTGEVVVRTIRTDETHTEFAPIGHSIGLAPRLQGLAPIGSIAATEQVRKLCEGYFAFTALGPSKVKGVSEPVKVYEVTGLGPVRTRLQRSAGCGHTKFVGRDREMEAMRRTLDLAKQKQGQVIGVVGEPGSASRD